MRASLLEILPPNQSPYFGMFTAGRNGYTYNEVVMHCQYYGIPLRQKDIQAWKDGQFKRGMISIMTTSGLDPSPLPQNQWPMKIEELKFEEFNTFPSGWHGTWRRFFPCSNDNRPLISWGWKPADKITGRPMQIPGLTSMADAKALSPVGWVGQNMLYQRFIVMDIDGVGHGCIDEQVIQFSLIFKNETLCYEDPEKLGSFHLYFKTNKIIPVKHFPHAKLDLMGNAVNAAVYFKNKISNNKQPLELTSEIWNLMMEYQKTRKEKQRCL